jgi:carboxyl-terminal processing protease
LKVTTAKYYVPSGRCIQALDYTHRRPDGSVGTIPDSLITEFKTRNGRVVLDGGGIDPDIEIEPEKIPEVASMLTQSGLIFQYATQYYFNHETIEPPSQFSITDQEYTLFSEWLTKQDFHYKTNVERALEEIKKAAQKEGNWSQLKEEYGNLQLAIERKKEKDLMIYKNQLSRLLEKDIVSRYYFESGAVESGFDEDIFVLKAIEILDNPEIYHQSLN